MTRITPRGLGRAAGNAAYQQVLDAATLRRMVNVTAADRNKSVTTHRSRYEDATQFIESWADLTNWTQSVANALQVSAGSVYGGSAGGGANHSFAIANSTGRMRIRAAITLPAAGTGGGITLVGVGNSGAGSSTVGGAFLQAIGVRETNIPIHYNAGSITNISGTALAAGTYYINVDVDENYVSAVMTNASGSSEWRIPTTGINRAAFAGINNAVVYNSDSRQLTGISIGKLGAAKDNVSINPRTGIEDLAPSVVHQPFSSGNQGRLSLPSSYDSRKPVPLIIHAHGAGEDETASISAAGFGPVNTALLAAGYAVLSGYNHGDNWGNASALSDLLNQYRYVRDHYAIGPVALIGQSMGGLAVLNALANRAFPEVACAYLIEPVTDLSAMFAANAGTYAAGIRTAYGIAADGSDYATKTAGYDPNLRSGYEFRGVPMRFVASASDVTVPKAVHTDIFQAKVAPYAPEASLLTATGVHGDTSEYNASDVTTFLASYLTV